VHPAHVPVLPERVVDLLAPALERPGAVVVDATVGMGGHAEALLRRCPQIRLVGLDRDPAALEHARGRLAAFGANVEMVHATYDQLPAVLAEQALAQIQGILFDLGVSSLQLDEAARGFSYARDAPLDMRMDLTSATTAADILNSYDAARLARVLRDYGEERFARQIAAAVVRERHRAPFTTSARLVELVRRVIPAPSRRTGGHPAKRTFQALRIEVNAELAILARTLPVALDALDIGGRIVVLSYHSLEDRLVKRALAARAVSTAPPGLPVELPQHRPQLRLLTRGAEKPTAAEISANPRAASARLRAAERIWSAA
jgi:16S rRNA (cytosine1402-N4)-methyltransferase